MSLEKLRLVHRFVQRIKRGRRQSGGLLHVRYQRPLLLVRLKVNQSGQGPLLQILLRLIKVAVRLLHSSRVSFTLFIAVLMENTKGLKMESYGEDNLIT